MEGDGVTRLRVSGTFAALAVVCLTIAGCANGSLRQTTNHESCAIGSQASETPPTTTGCIPPPPQRVMTNAGSYAFSSVGNAPEILAAEARSNAAGEEVNKALAAKLPTVGLLATAGGGTEINNIDEGRRTGGTYSYALGVEIPLYQGGRADAAISAARADHRASTEATKDRRVATAYELALALARISQQREAIVILDRQERTLRRLAGEVRAEIKGGATSRVDVDDVNRQLAHIAVAREEARLAVTEAEYTTRRLGISPDAKLPGTAGLGLPGNEQELVALAMRENPRVKERVARVEGADFRVAQAKGEMLPTVSAGVRLIGEQGLLADVDDSHQGVAEVRFSLPIYTGGSRSATIRQRADEKLSALLERDAAVEGVVAAVRSAIDRRNKARRMLTLAEAEKRSSATMLEGLRAERKVGERSTFDEIRAIENFANAELNLSQARYQLRAADYTLAAETGQMERLVSAVPVTEPIK